MFHISEEALGLLSVTGVGKSITAVINGEVAALEDLGTVPKAMVQRLKRSSEALGLMTEAVKRGATVIGGSSVAFVASKNEAAGRRLTWSPSGAPSAQSRNGSKKLPKKELIDITNFLWTPSEAKALRKTAPAPKPREGKLRSEVPSDDPVPPLPKGQEYFTSKEAAEMLHNRACSAKQLRDSGRVPCKKSRLSELKSDRAKGVLEPRPWGHIGRTAFATHGELEALLAERTEGQTLSDDLPNFKQIMRTCARPLSLEEEQLVHSTTIECIQIATTRGGVTEANFDRLGYPLDRNSQGEFVIKTAGITNKSSHRAKCLSSDYVCQERKESLEAQRAVEATKAALSQQKLLALIDEAEQAKKKLLELMDKPATSSNNQLVHCTKAQLAILKASELKALYHVRNFDTASLPAGFGGWPNKGTEADEGSLISRVYQRSRTKPVILKVATAAPIIAAAPPVLEPVVVVPESGNGFGPQPLPSEHLANSEWLSRAESALVGRVVKLCVDGGERADALLKETQTRLQRHMAQRIPDSHLHSHWSLTWFKVNMSRTAALVTAFGHLKRNVQGIPSECLPAPQSRFLAVEGGTAKLEGCYLANDEEDWIRSGKVAGEKRNIGARLAEHKAASLLRTVSDRSSLFYLSYPSKQSKVPSVG